MSANEKTEFTLIMTDPAGAETQLDFAKNDIIIGREDGDYLINHKSVSKRHARIVLFKGNLYVEDLNSRNGTYINAERLVPNKPMIWKSGEKLRIADNIFVIADNAPQETALDNEKTANIKINANDDNEIKLRKTIHNQLIKLLDSRNQGVDKMGDKELKQFARKNVLLIVRELNDAGAIPINIDTDALINDTLDEALGLGPLEDLLSDDAVSDIMINQGGKIIYVERKGRMSKTDKSFSSENSVRNAIERMLAPIGRRVDESSPMVDARLADGSRVHIAIPPVAIDGPTVTIRKFVKDKMTADALIKVGSLSRNMASFLKLCVLSRQNIIVSGGTGSGKTTLLNALSNFIPESERIVIIEDSNELQLQQEHKVRMEARTANIEGKGQITIRELLRNALRMRPDRIVIGECRGGEALDMLQAMNTGHDGSLTTLHSNSPRDSLSRLETMVLMAGMDLPLKAIRTQIASAVNIVIHLSKFSKDGSRKITEISEITGLEGDIITMQDIFTFDRANKTFMPTRFIPRFVERLKAQGENTDDYMPLFK
ncbi:MAG: ATPase, T2SS/T4P/T4SS family [Parcubacteria group bacterium]